MDSKYGSADLPCGQYRDKPCKDLAKGVTQTDFAGTLFLVGTYKLSQSIKLNRGITITSENNRAIFNWLKYFICGCFIGPSFHFTGAAFS